jgi:hypothetical protein
MWEGCGFMGCVVSPRMSSTPANVPTVQIAAVEVCLRVQEMSVKCARTSEGMFFFHLGYMGFAPDNLPDSDAMRLRACIHATPHM